MQQEFGLIVDWETTGLIDQDVPWRTYLEGPQGIEIGAILVHLPEFEPIAEFVSRVRFLGTAHGISYNGALYERLTWSDEAVQIHGITVHGLTQAPHPTEVCERLISFLKHHTKIEELEKNPIMLCGHNPAFDQYHTKQLLFLGNHERKIRFTYRMIDSFSLGYVIFGIKSSDELFKRVCGVERQKHSALEDARLTLAALQNIYRICRSLTM